MFKPGMSLVISGVIFACAFSAGAQNKTVGFSLECIAEFLASCVFTAVQHGCPLRAKSGSYLLA